MDEQFQQIKAEYDEFYKALLRQGRLPTMDTGDGYWGVSVAEEVFELFKRIKLNKTTNFIDLGHGDGKVVMIASLFTNASGIEQYSWLSQTSNMLKRRLSHINGVKSSRLLEGDYHQHKLDLYDTIFMFPDKKFSAGLQDKLLKEAKGSKLIVQGHIYQPTFFDKHKTHEINGTLFHEFRL